MPRKNDVIALRINRRELATILAALRFHKDENIRGSRQIADKFIKEIATDGGLLKPLDFDEVGNLCERLNMDEDQRPAKGLVIEPPHKEGGYEKLYRVVYVLDTNAANPIDAARQTHRIMSDPESQPPVLEVIDHRGKSLSIDLSQEAPA
jgi:hypothetical protein